MQVMLIAESIKTFEITSSMQFHLMKYSMEVSDVKLFRRPAGDAPAAPR